MMSFGQYLIANPWSLIICIVFGAIFGLVSSLGNCSNIKDRAGYVLVGILTWSVILYPLTAWTSYSDYRKNYVTCDKYEAKQAGYIFQGEKCWAKTSGYVKVSDEVKTKQELLNDK